MDTSPVNPANIPGDALDPSGQSTKLQAPREDVADLGDLRELADEVFRVWTGGSEVRWAAHAWACLGRAGLVQYQTEVERARTVCRLLALAVLSREFYARARDEGSPGDWSLTQDDAVGEYPRIDPFVLGQLTEREGIDADIEVGYEFDEGTASNYALREIVGAQYRIVTKALASEWGTVGVFTSLWASTYDDVEYPIAQDDIYDMVNTDVTAEKLDAYQWIDDGMHRN